MDDLTAHRMIDMLPRLRRFAFALCGNLSDADDLVQITCERAISGFDGWRRGSRLDSWMFTILRNAYLDDYRGRSLRAKHRTEVEMSGGGSLDGVRAAEANIMLSRAQELLDNTPEDQRSALLLALLEGLSYEEIASIQQVSVGTVTSRIGRAREALRNLLGAGKKAEEREDRVGSTYQ